MCQLAICSSEFYLTLFYAFWVLDKEQVASNECTYGGIAPLCSYPLISVSHCLPHILFVSDSIKLGRACNKS